jgi:heat shock protein HslJ
MFYDFIMVADSSSIFIHQQKTTRMSSIFGNPTTHNAGQWAADALDQRRTQKDKPRHSLSIVGVGTMAHGTSGVRSVGREYYTIDVCGC